MVTQSQSHTHIKSDTYNHSHTQPSSVTYTIVTPVWYWQRYSHFPTDTTYCSYIRLLSPTVNSHLDPNTCDWCECLWAFSLTKHPPPVSYIVTLFTVTTSQPSTITASETGRHRAEHLWAVVLTADWRNDIFIVINCHLKLYMYIWCSIKCYVNLCWL